MIWFFACKEKFKHWSFVVSYKIWKQEKGVFFAYKETSQKLIFYCLTVKKKEKQHSIFRSVEEKLDQILFRLDESVQVSLSFIAKHFCTVSSKMHLHFWPWKWGPSTFGLVVEAPQIFEQVSKDDYKALGGGSPPSEGGKTYLVGPDR